MSVALPTIRSGLQTNGRIFANPTAMLAGYAAADPSPVKPPANWLGTNPNGPFSTFQRRQLSLEGQEAIKNTPFAINYVAKRVMYCSGGMSYAPDTGDHELDAAILAYCEEQWRNMGAGGSSMYDAYSRVSDVFQPQAGDAFLQWYEDEDCLRLLEITADRVGERYTSIQPQSVGDGETYYAGVFMRGPNITRYKVYDRQGDSVYANPHYLPAWDVIHFIDDITGGIRGVSPFFGALKTTQASHQILKNVMDTMQLQSKIGIVASNNSGGALEYSYENRQNLDGGVVREEHYADGAVERFIYNGDSYQAFRAEQPTEAFIGGLRYLDERAALAMRFPYSFLFSGSQSGGAPFRGDYEIASKEILRLRDRYHRPRLNKISYRTILYGVHRKKLPPHPNIYRGEWLFNALPTADSFRDDKSDIMAIRAGITTRNEVVRARGNRSFADVLRVAKQEAIMIQMAAQDANKELAAAGYQPTVDVSQIAQDSDNPGKPEPQNEDVSQS